MTNMKTMKKKKSFSSYYSRWIVSSFLLGFAFITTTTTTSVSVVAAEANDNNFVLNLLHVNDHHSHLEEDTLKIPSLSKTNTPNVKKVARTIHYGGYPRIIRLLKQLEAKNNNTLSIHAGDALVGTGYYRLFGVSPDVDMMHQICYDIFNLGNHEFDDGDEVLADFVNKLADINSPCQNTRVLSANLFPGQKSPLFPLRQLGFIAPHVIRSFPSSGGGGGKQTTTTTATTTQVAFIGINIKDKTINGSQPDPGTTFLDERTAIRQQIRILEKIGINKIILVSHLGFSKDKSWVTKLEGIDAVIGAHSHTLMTKTASSKKDKDKDGSPLTSKNQYPKVVYQRTSGKKVCIGHAWKYGKGVGHLQIEFDNNGDVVNCGGSFMVPFEPNRQSTKQDSTTVTKYLEGLPTGPTFVRTRQDPKALAVLAKYTKQMHGKQLFDTVLIKQVSVQQPLCKEDIPGHGKSNSCTTKEEDTKALHGGMACQLVAQAMLNQTLEADVAIHNAGGCQADIMAGDFTYGRAMELLPYSDSLVTVTMTGRQIELVLEQAIDLALTRERNGDDDDDGDDDDSSSGSYPYASGLRFSVNASEDFGLRISHLQLNSRLAEGAWNDINYDMNYTVVTNSFLADGRDGYLEFSNLNVTSSRHDTGETILGAFITYLEERGSITSPDTENMSTQSFLDGSKGNQEDPIQAVSGINSQDELGTTPLWMKRADMTDGYQHSITYGEQNSTDGSSLLDPLLDESWPLLEEISKVENSNDPSTSKSNSDLKASAQIRSSISPASGMGLSFTLVSITVATFFLH